MNEWAVASIVTTVSECPTQGASSGLVGNPCDVKTGEKVQNEEDFELDWVDLSRTYRSGVAYSTGGFGAGWLHTHGMRLAIESAQIGLIESTGYTAQFQKAGDDFISTNGSGERIVKNGLHWILGRGDGTYSFDETGRLNSRVQADGSALLYSYDEYKRLERISSLQGRSIQFNYLGNSADALIVGISTNGVQLAEYSYNDGILESVIFPDGTSRVYHYEDPRFKRHLTGITAENGLRYGMYAYDSEGRVTSSQHAGGVAGVSLTYSQTGTAVIDSLGELTTYVMTDAGGGTPKVSSVTDSAGSINYQYYDRSTDFRRRLRSVTDRKGTESVHTYGEIVDAATARPASVHAVTEAFGLPEQRIIEEHTDLASNRLLVSSLGDREQRYTYNTRFQPISITTTDRGSNESRTTAYAYCEAADVSTPGSSCPIEGLLRTIDGPRTDISDITSFMYYSSDAPACSTTPSACSYRRGDLWRVTNALGQAREVLTYDEAGRQLSVKDINGVITNFEYHPRGWLTASHVQGAGNDDRSTQIAYWPTGMVQRVTHPNGAYTEYDYDAAHRLTAIRDNAGNTIAYTLDNAGNRVAEDINDSSGTLRRTLSRVFNQLGQLVTQADSGDNPTDVTYDPNGNSLTITDPLGRQTANTYDGLNRLKSALQDVGGIDAATDFEYDAFDNLTKVTDPKGLETRYTFNAFGNLRSLESPDTGTTTYLYDSSGNRIGQLDARGQASSYTYDALNRLTRVAYTGAPELDIVYVYDAVQPDCAAGEGHSVGRMTAVIDVTGGTQYCYDRFGNVVRKVQVTNGQTFVVRYAYDKANRLRQLTYPDGTVADYVRDEQGRITEVAATSPGGVREILLTDASYYPFGPSAGWTYGNGRTLSRSHDLDYRAASIQDTAAGGMDLGFSYDAVGQLSHLRSAALTDPPRVQFDYDPLGRLTAFRDGETQTLIEQYAYDATGNRTTFASSSGIQAYAYAADSHLLASVAGVPRTYDVAGSTVTDGMGRTFTYNAANRLVSVAQNGSQRRQYSYNGRGERVRSYLGLEDITSVYDEAGHWLGDYDIAATPLQQAIWLDDAPVGLLVGGAAASGRLHYVQPDHLGTPRVVIEPARNVPVWRWDLASEAFGNSPPHQDPDGDGGVFVLDKRFPGQRHDAASGLNYNYFRDYDPMVGRYSQSDPTGLAGGISTYSYVGADPISFFDPFGLQGHHYVPRQIYNRYNFPPEARRVFQRSTTGKVTHYYDRGHRSYNQAVGTYVDDFIRRNNIDPSKMTAQQAQQCVDEVKASQQPDIKNYLEHLRGGGGLFRVPMICLFCSILLPMPEDGPDYDGPPIV
ncbi:RHS repeat-associated core domain-containing protein [Luteimonas fraxinea]|uniref:RHS repeat-associated core domain-containing protein n=1 Tax=Luteimonas fraxinea TaxID=2901869 RepID=UPI001E5FDC7E|nr:RHS repeat-associated core domain-containing protein [Luteimonas fraxinea]